MTQEQADYIVERIETHYKEYPFAADTTVEEKRIDLTYRWMDIREEMGLKGYPKKDFHITCEAWRRLDDGIVLSKPIPLS